MGRPSNFTQQIADAICYRIADGESLRKICDDEEMPGQRTVYSWLDGSAEFQQQYARAREMQADTMADDILSIADDGRNDSYVDDNGNKRTDQDVIARSRLRVEARKWLASKMAPKKYGDKLAIGGADDLPPIKTLSDEALAAKIAEKMAALNGRTGKE